MKKIMIVDNDEGIDDVLKYEWLEKGYVVKTVNVHRDILATIYKDKPDVILLEATISGVDGRQICLQLKQTHIADGICIILFSDDASLIAEYDTWMADGVLGRPFQINLISEIFEICKTKSV